MRVGSTRSSSPRFGLGAAPLSALPVGASSPYKEKYRVEIQQLEEFIRRDLSSRGWSFSYAGSEYRPGTKAAIGYVDQTRTEVARLFRQKHTSEVVAAISRLPKDVSSSVISSVRAVISPEILIFGGSEWGPKEASFIADAAGDNDLFYISSVYWNHQRNVTDYAPGAGAAKTLDEGPVTEAAWLPEARKWVKVAGIIGGGFLVLYVINMALPKGD